MSRRPWSVETLSAAAAMLESELTSISITEMEESEFDFVALSLETDSVPRVVLRAPTRIVYGCFDWERIWAMLKPIPWVAPGMD